MFFHVLRRRKGGGGTGMANRWAIGIAFCGKKKKKKKEEKKRTSRSFFITKSSSKGKKETRDWSPLILAWRVSLP